MWVLVGLTAALIGLVPRASCRELGLPRLCFVIGMFGQLLDLPAWLENLSPFQHVPQLPAADVRVRAGRRAHRCSPRVSPRSGLVGLGRRDIG